MDPLTDVFTSMRVESVVYGRLEATAPWGLRFEAPTHAKFGMVLRGTCWLTVDGLANPIPLAAGDCYLLTRGGAYSLHDNPRTPARDFTEVLGPRPCGGVIQLGGGGEPTTILGGRFEFDAASSKPLTDILPPVIQVRADEAASLSLYTTLQLLAAEMAAPGPGSQVIVSRLADTLFVQAIRAHVASTDGSKTGWLRALSDPPIGAALTAIHERIEGPWTVAALASIAGMSRSAFALRFKEIVGEAPLEYLTRWRMHRASRLLRDGKRKLFDVAKLVGYDSDGAFHKAFKRELGVTPGEYRSNGGPAGREHPGITPLPSGQAQPATAAS